MSSALDTHPTTAPGRSCPLHYRYPPASLRRPAEATCEVLYVVGGLYGNTPALEAVLALFEQEHRRHPGQARLVFNGDFHWFDTDPARFGQVQAAVLAHDALRGNVETELGDEVADGPDAGCGCAYPDWVGDGVVERSNRILQRLRQTTRAQPGAAAALAALPMTRRIDVGPLRVAVVHGDAQSLAGWGFAVEHLRQPGHRAEVLRWFDAADVHAFACSHTCLPVFHTLRRRGEPADAAPRLVLNNGAAGMPNFSGDSAGLLTRIALTPSRSPARRHGRVLQWQGQALYIDALAIDHDTARWRADFDAQWPPGSDAQASYGARILAGPDHRPSEAILETED